MNMGVGVGGGNLDKTGPHSGHGPKGQAPIHAKVGACVHACVCVCDRGRRDSTNSPKRFYMKAAAYFKHDSEKGRDHEAHHASNTASSQNSLLFTWPLHKLDTHLQRMPQKSSNYYCSVHKKGQWMNCTKDLHTI